MGKERQRELGEVRQERKKLGISHLCVQIPDRGMLRGRSQALLGDAS